MRCMLLPVPCARRRTEKLCSTQQWLVPLWRMQSRRLPALIVSLGDGWAAPANYIYFTIVRFPTLLSILIVSEGWLLSGGYGKHSAEHARSRTAHCLRLVPLTTLSRYGCQISFQPPVGN